MIELLLQAERALEMGRIDAAETLYHQVADNDPRNAIAVVGLARVALERGDEAGALDLALRALVIDPENAAAGRMVARLEEVAAFRSETAVDTGVDTAPAEATDAATMADTAAAAPAVVAAESVVVAPSTAAEAPVDVAEGRPAPEAADAPVKARAPTVAPAPKRRRSWLDRLLRRNR